MVDLYTWAKTSQPSPQQIRAYYAKHPCCPPCVARLRGIRFFWWFTVDRCGMWVARERRDEYGRSIYHTGISTYTKWAHCQDARGLAMCTDGAR